MSIRQYEDSVKNWKTKAIARRKEKDRLVKRVKELTLSRDRWKAKYQQQQSPLKATDLLAGERAAKHHYSLSLVMLVLELYKYGGMSLRSCRHSLHCMFLSLGLSISVPSHSSLRNWLCKCGIYRVLLRPSTADCQVLIVDESITFGSEKMLLILGVSASKVRSVGALTHNDVSVLYVGSSPEWTGKQIKEQIEKSTKVEQIKYVVSDQGTNLRKAYRLLNYSHIEDCTHVLANYLKRIYGSDKDFEAFRQLIGQLRRDWNLNKAKSQYMPPTMRGKMRFANIFPCVSWAKKILSSWETLSEEVQIALSFLKNKSELITSLIEIASIFKFVGEKLKSDGFGKQQKQDILTWFSRQTWGERSQIFIKNCKAYLAQLTEKRRVLKEEKLLCTSDIIESYFGKFKTKVNPNNRSGLTEFMFTVATFGQSFSAEEVKQAMQNIKIKDLKQYRNTQKAA